MSGERGKQQANQLEEGIPPASMIQAACLRATGAKPISFPPEQLFLCIAASPCAINSVIKQLRTRGRIHNASQRRTVPVGIMSRKLVNGQIKLSRGAPKITPNNYDRTTLQMCSVNLSRKREFVFESKLWVVGT